VVLQKTHFQYVCIYHLSDLNIKTVQIHCSLNLELKRARLSKYIWKYPK